MSEVTFDIPTCPFDKKQKLYSKKNLTIKTGMTTLVGCNGSGKSTLLTLLKEYINDREGALIINYDDRYHGGHNLIEKFMMTDRIQEGASMFVSSEGERIYKGLGELMGQIARAVRRDDVKELWVLMDAVGSGLSIDNIDELKDVLQVITEDRPNIDLYFIISTNEYEFTIGADNIDVTTFKHMTFKGYDDYREFIMKTRKKKNERGW